ncbi:unnamed protein product [Paramecium sonneborni]|uniref:Uncharacterized protein n=1 Tax=Paramecium sonneborni TaxID=65129 RepID=A0A8S1RPZ3_9CILI|nr:unnamed protein product [Paramecium sonneborni]
MSVGICGGGLAQPTFKRAYRMVSLKNIVILKKLQMIKDSDVLMKINVINIIKMDVSLQIVLRDVMYQNLYMLKLPEM